MCTVPSNKPLSERCGRQPEEEDDEESLNTFLDSLDSTKLVSADEAIRANDRWRLQQRESKVTTLCTLNAMCALNALCALCALCALIPKRCAQKPRSAHKDYPLCINDGTMSKDAGLSWLLFAKFQLSLVGVFFMLMITSLPSWCPPSAQLPLCPSALLVVHQSANLSMQCLCTLHNITLS